MNRIRTLLRTGQPQRPARNRVLRVPIAIAAGLSIAAAAPALASAASRTPAAPASAQTAAIKLPPLPTKVGCYRRINDVWLRVACESAAYIRAHVPHPELEDGIASSTSSPGPSFKAGYIQLLGFHTGTETDSKAGTDAFSIQDNTNTYTGTNGATDADQFTDQSQLGYEDNVCVWQVKVSGKQKYTATCVAAPFTGTRGLSMFFLAPLVEGTVEKGGKIATFAYLPWSVTSSFMYVVVAKDLYGLAGHWHNNSGALLGLGNGSHAQISAGLFYTSLGVSDCSANMQASCQGLAPLWGHLTRFSSGLTEETNNLIPVIGAPPAHLPGLKWVNHDSAYIYYASTPTGKCPAGTLPPLCSAN
jgi:hypothetical protein